MHATRRFLCTAVLLAAPTLVAAPDLVVKKPEYDFGTRKNTEVVTHDFLLENKGDEPLKIGSVRTSCGCTVAKLSKRLLDPGDSVHLTAEFQLRGRQGLQYKTIFIRSNDPDEPLLKLVLKGDARSLIEVVPKHLSFGRISGEKSETRLVQVTLNEPVALELRKVEDRDNAFDITMKNNTSNLNRQTIVVKTAKGLAPGIYRGDIVLAEKDKEESLTSVGVYLRVLDKLSVMPTEIIVPQDSKDITRNVIVTEGKVKTFEIRNVEVPLRGIKAAIKPIPGRGYMIELSGIRGVPELHGKTLKITTDVKGLEEVTVPFRIIEPTGTSR